MPDSSAQTSLLLPPRGTVLGFDFGLSRTGVAVGELETGQASPLKTLHQSQNQLRFAAIAQLIAEWQAVALVVGIPYHLDGQAHALSERCRRFGRQLHARSGLPVVESDERLSSCEAQTALDAVGRRHWRKNKKVLDALAAQIILQQFLDKLKHE